LSKYNTENLFEEFTIVNNASKLVKPAKLNRSTDHEAFPVRQYDSSMQIAKTIAKLILQISANN